MNYLLGFFIMMLAAVLQSTLLPHLKFMGGTVDLPLLLTLGWTLAGDWRGGVGWGFMGGLFLDLLSGGPPGAMAFSLTLMAYLASLTEGRFWHSHLLLPLGTALLGTLGSHGLYLSLLMYSGYKLDWHTCLTYATLPALFLNTVCMLPTYYSLRRLHSWIFPPRITI